MKISEYYKQIEEALEDFKRIEFYRSLYIFTMTKIRIGDVVRKVDKTNKQTLISTLDDGKNLSVENIVLRENYQIKFILSDAGKELTEDDLIRVDKGNISNSKVTFGGGNYEEVSLDKLQNVTKRFVDNLLSKISEIKSSYTNSSPLKIGDEVKVKANGEIGNIDSVYFDINGNYLYNISKHNGHFYVTLTHPDHSIAFTESQIEKL